MDYKIKLFFTWALEIFPFKDELYFFIQKNILKSLKINKEAIDCYEKSALHNLEKYKKINNSNPDYVLEFGSGWILAFPLIFSKYCANVIASDIKCLAREAVNIELEKFLNLSLNRIKYIYPCDISNTGFKDRSFDLIVSNSVLEHIPRELIPKMANECYRILSERGICSFHVAHRDHWSHTDSNLEPMNYLRFSEKRWKLMNPPLNFQNRMLQSEYVSIFEKAGFICEVKSSKVPCKVKINNHFKNLPKEDFDTTHSDFTLIKK